MPHYFMMTDIWKPNKKYGDKVYSNFRPLNVPEVDIESESFTVISVDLFLVYENKYYLQVYLDNCAYKIVDKKIIDYLDNNLFEIFLPPVVY